MANVVAVAERRKLNIKKVVIIAIIRIADCGETMRCSRDRAVYLGSNMSAYIETFSTKAPLAGLPVVRSELLPP